MANIKANLKVKTIDGYDKLNLSSESDLISYTNTNASNITNSKQALDSLIKSYTTQQLTIPIIGWVDDSTYNCKKLDVPIEGLLASDIVDVNLGMSSLTVAEDCQLKSTVESYDGKFTLRSAFVPSSEMTGTLIIHKVVS